MLHRTGEWGPPPGWVTFAALRGPVWANGLPHPGCSALIVVLLIRMQEWTGVWTCRTALAARGSAASYASWKLGPSCCEPRLAAVASGLEAAARCKRCVRVLFGVVVVLRVGPGGAACECSKRHLRTARGGCFGSFFVSVTILVASDSVR
eukprot:15142915-Alexandrium_andersonii.AAC.1